MRQLVRRSLVVVFAMAASNCVYDWAAIPTGDGAADVGDAADINSNDGGLDQTDVVNEQDTDAATDAVDIAMADVNYAVSTTGGYDLMIVGDNSISADNPYNAMCDAGALVVGLQLEGQPGVTATDMYVECAALNADGTVGHASLQFGPYGATMTDAGLNDLCPDGGAAVGVYGVVCGSTCSIVSALGVECAMITTWVAGSSPDGGITQLPTVGAGGNPFEEHCDPGYFLVGLSGRWGGGIDSVQGHCAPVTH